MIQGIEKGIASTIPAWHMKGPASQSFEGTLVLMRYRPFILFYIIFPREDSCGEKLVSNRGKLGWVDPALTLLNFSKKCNKKDDDFFYSKRHKKIKLP